MSQILVVGSLAYDSIQTPAGTVKRTLGGSANYFSLAASFNNNVRVVGVIGDDYEQSHINYLTQRQVDTTGIIRGKGKTFHWAGTYAGDLNEATTLTTDLNVFAEFNPVLPENYCDSEFVFLANIDPVLQLRVLEQIRRPKLVAMDTMNFWITSNRAAVLEVLKRIQVLFINESEAKLLTNQTNTILALQDLVKMGPGYIVLKRGEYGFILYQSHNFFMLPAFPTAEVIDPTGAGDSFAGGFLGFLSRQNNPIQWNYLKHSCLHGCVMASFTIQDFGVQRLLSLSWADVESRMSEYHKFVSIN